MFDLNGCNLRYDLHQARTARITARGGPRPPAGRVGTVRARLAAALIALAARLAPPARPPAPIRPVASDGRR